MTDPTPTRRPETSRPPADPADAKAAKEPRETQGGRDAARALPPRKEQQGGAELGGGKRMAPGGPQQPDTHIQTEAKPQSRQGEGEPTPHKT